MVLAAISQPKKMSYFFNPALACALISHGMGNFIPLPHGRKAVGFGSVFYAVSIFTESVWYLNWDFNEDKLRERSSLQVIADLVISVAFIFFATYVINSIELDALQFKSDFFLESGIKPDLNLFIITALIFGSIDFLSM